MCMLPYTNSHDTGKIDESTTQVFIECTGTDFWNVHYALNIFVTMFADMGADIYSLEIVYPDKTITTPDLKPRKMKFSLDYINKWLGFKLSEKKVIQLLRRMGYGYEKNTALIPSFRPDVIHQADLSEDIAIAFGYENFAPVIPNKGTTGREDEFEKFRTKVSRILVGLNLLETSSYHLSNKNIQFKLMNFNSSDYIKLANSVSVEYNIMRYSMLANLMQILMENTHNEYPQNIFESGYCFRLGKTDTGVVEENKLAVALCHNNVDYTKIRQVLDYLFNSLGLKYEIKETTHPTFIAGRVGKVIVSNIEIGVLGELSPKVISNFEVEMPIAGFEIDLKKVFGLLNQEIKEYVHKGNFQFNLEVLDKYPKLIIESKIIKDIKVSESLKDINHLKKKLVSEWIDKDLETEKELQKYKELHNELGLGDKSAAEMLIKRYLKKGKFPNINSAVDLGNIITVKNLTSIGLFDYDKIKGEIKIRFSKLGDEYLAYGSKNMQKIKPGKLILEDNEKIFAVIGYKDSQETKVDKDTKNLFIVSWGDKAKKVIEEYENMIKEI